MIYIMLLCLNPPSAETQLLSKLSQMQQKSHAIVCDGRILEEITSWYVMA